MSSKVKVGRLRDVVGFKSGEAKKALDKRDPRFDALCGDYDEKVKQNVVFSCQMQKKKNVNLQLLSSLSPSFFGINKSTYHCNLLVSFVLLLFFQVFKQSYEFVEEVKSKEREHLKKELANEQDEERIKQIKYLIQRMVCFMTL